VGGSKRTSKKQFRTFITKGHQLIFGGLHQFIILYRFRRKDTDIFDDFRMSCTFHFVSVVKDQYILLKVHIEHCTEVKQVDIKLGTASLENSLKQSDTQLKSKTNTKQVRNTLSDIIVLYTCFVLDTRVKKRDRQSKCQHFSRVRAPLPLPWIWSCQKVDPFRILVRN
jgi:hypothetical protein